MEKNLGHATAYGYAKSKGYSGTEEEFAQLMADYASVGQSAAQSAEQAATSAESASGSAATASQAAQTATSKASEAVTAADMATTKASEASTSASTASSAATSASTSAQTATTAATTATAKASEASESATTASAAKTDAESARDAAAQSASQAAASAESIDPDEFDRKIYAAFATDTASGSIAHFEDGADSIPMKDVFVHIEPVQEGSGDPSPDNVRPISGWTGAKVTRTGKNLFPRKTISLGKPRDRTATVIFDQPIKPGTYIVSYKKSGTYTDMGFGIDCLNGNKNIGCVNINTGVLTISEEGTRLYFYYPRSNYDNNETLIFDEIQLELGSTATDYEPYSGQTYSIAFPSEAGTVYGGTLDVTSGVLTVDRAQIASYNGEALPSTWISDRDVYASGTTPTIGAQVCYELTTPITYTLTPQEITSLLGANNLWANTGDSEVEYRANTVLWVQRKITEAVSALS